MRLKRAEPGPRLAFAAVAYAFAAVMLGTTLPTPLYNLYEAEFGFSQLMVTVIYATCAIGVIGVTGPAGLVAGFSQGLSFRAGLTAVNDAAPADRRAETASAFFLVACVAIWIPVVGVGLLAQITTLVTAGITFAAVVATISATVVLLLRFDRHG